LIFYCFYFSYSLKNAIFTPRAKLLALLFCESQEFHQEQRFWLCSSAKAKSFTKSNAFGFALLLKPRVSLLVKLLVSPIA